MERHTNLKTLISTWKVNYNRIQYNQAYVQLENVVETHVVYGEYDLAARIDFKDDKEMSKILIGEFRNIPGVEQTETLIAMEV